MLKRLWSRTDYGMARGQACRACYAQLLNGSSGVLASATQQGWVGAIAPAAAKFHSFRVNICLPTEWSRTEESLENHQVPPSSAQKLCNEWRCFTQNLLQRYSRTSFTPVNSARRVAFHQKSSRAPDAATTRACEWAPPLNVSLGWAQLFN
jgi:hypothetical protein